MRKPAKPASASGVSAKASSAFHSLWQTSLRRARWMAALTAPVEEDSVSMPDCRAPKQRWAAAVNQGPVQLRADVVQMASATLSTR